MISNLSSDIQISNCESIDSLDVFTSLESLNGNFSVINCPKISYISPLNKLLEIGGTLHLESTGLKQISSFLGLEKIGGDLYLRSEHYNNFHGLDSVQSIGGIDFKTLLVPSFAGLERVDTIHGNVIIHFCQTIKNFTSNFQSLQYIDGDFSIKSCFSLEQFTGGYDNLNSINGNVEFIENNSLLLIDDFPSLKSVFGTINIQENNKLTNINSIGVILEETLSLFVKDNPLLQAMEFPPLIDTLSFLLIDENPKLTTLGNTSALKHIEYDLWLKENASLADFNAFSSLKSINRDCIVNNCDELGGLQGFINLQIVKNNFIIEGNDNMVSLQGLESLQSVIGTFELKNNLALASLEGLTNLLDVGYLLLKNNKVLSGINEIENIASIGHLELNFLDSLEFDFVFLNLDSLKILTVTRCKKIKDLSPFVNLVELKNRLSLNSNINLENIDLIKDVNIDSIDVLIMRDNEKLSFCAYENICTYLDEGGNSFIMNNLACNDAEEILFYCYEPECSVITFPTEGAELDPDNVTIEWEENVLVEEYTLILGSCPTCNDIDSLQVSGTSYTIPFLNPFGEYYVRILTKNEFGFSQNCETVFFTTGTGADCSFAMDTFFTQSQVDSFRIQYAHCENVFDSLILYSEDISNLDSLFGLENINYLELSNTSITNVKGIHWLQTVNEFVIQNNSSLDNLSDLSINLEIIESLTIRNNSQLEMCHDLPICNFLIENGNALIVDNPEGCSTISDIIDRCFVSTDENEVSEIHIYPNPSNGQFIIEGEKLINQLSIYNSKGMLIKSEFDIKKTLEIEKLDSGLYVLKIEIDNQIFVRKVVVH